MNHKHIWIAATAILLTFNLLILQKENALANGESIFLELTPRDPRSLMQGDYMTLNYQLTNDIRTHLANNPKTPNYGRAILRIDENNVAHLQTLEETPATTLQPHQRTLKWRKTPQGQISIGAPTYFFQEGRAEHFQQAKYAELKLSPSGSTLLVHLLDPNRNPL